MVDSEKTENVVLNNVERFRVNKQNKLVIAEYMAQSDVTVNKVSRKFLMALLYDEVVLGEK